ncbi:MAG: hypothetical protein JO166_06220 [Deltaproteobacteria bacterium]|nr:hypothetical protein [Deltaproteobacteria bacterium]
MIPILTMTGIVVDVGWAYFTRESAQTAAQAAAIAAAKSAMDGVAAGGTYTCGSHGLGCQSATACAATTPSPITSNLQNGCAYAITNGFTNGGLSGRQTVTIAANITSPAPTVPGVTVSYWATVYITQQNPLTFLAILGGSTLNVGVRATAGVIAATTQNCLVVLDPTGNQSLTISGGAAVNASACATEVESSSSDALDVSGGSSLTSSSIKVVGNYNGHGCSSCISPTPTTGVPAFSDPLASLVAPTYTASHCDYTNENINGGTVTLSQGNYCGGIAIQGGATVTFSAGTYILLGGGLTIHGGSTVTGSGVTFYNTYNGGNPNNYKPVSISAATVTLSAPTTGALSGILFFQDRTAKASGQESFTGGSSVNLTGTLYFPVSKTQLVFSGGSGGSSSNTTIVAYDVTVSGASYLGSSSGSSSGPSQPTAALIE